MQLDEFYKVNVPVCSGLGISTVSLAEAPCAHPQVQIRFTRLEHHVNGLLQNILSCLAFFTEHYL